MRILFSTVPAYGHLLPLAPLMTAALADGHVVGVLTSGGMSEVIAAELPGAIEHLAVGPMSLEFAEETSRRTGQDVYRPTPHIIGEMFGGTRLDRSAEQALALASAWRPDLIVADAFDTVGPLLAADLAVAWYQAGLGPGLPRVIVDEIAAVASGRYATHGLTPVPASGYLDPCPPLLQEPGWTSAVARLPIRPQAHRRPAPGPSAPEFPLPGFRAGQRKKSQFGRARRQHADRVLCQCAGTRWTAPGPGLCHRRRRTACSARSIDGRATAEAVR